MGVSHADLNALGQSIVFLNEKYKLFWLAIRSLGTKLRLREIPEVMARALQLGAVR